MIIAIIIITRKGRLQTFVAFDMSFSLDLSYTCISFHSMSLLLFFDNEVIIAMTMMMVMIITVLLPLFLPHECPRFLYALSDHHPCFTHLWLFPFYPSSFLLFRLYTLLFSAHHSLVESSWNTLGNVWQLSLSPMLLILVGIVAVLVIFAFIIVIIIRVRSGSNRVNRKTRGKKSYFLLIFPYFRLLFTHFIDRISGV